MRSSERQPAHSPDRGRTRPRTSIEPAAQVDGLQTAERTVDAAATALRAPVLTVGSIRALQRTVGNAATTRLLTSRRHAAPGAQHLIERHDDHQAAAATAALVQRDDNKGPGAAVEGTGDVSIYAGKTMTAEAALREIYDKSARSITEEALRMVQQGTSPEDAARWAVQARNELKVAIRAKGSPITQGLAEARNMRKYGNKVGPTYDELIREGKTPEDIIGKAGRASVKVNRFASRMRLAGRLAIAIDVAIVTWEVIEAPENERLRTAVKGAGGIGGALAGGWAGAKIGAAIGTFIEPGGGTAVGGFIGGVVGAIAGGIAGRAAAGAAYDYVDELFTPNLDSDMSSIDAAEDARIRAAAPAAPQGR